VDKLTKDIDGAHHGQVFLLEIFLFQDLMQVAVEAGIEFDDTADILADQVNMTGRFGIVGFGKRIDLDLLDQVDGLFELIETMIDL